MGLGIVIKSVAAPAAVPSRFSLDPKDAASIATREGAQALRCHCIAAIPAHVVHLAFTSALLHFGER